MPPAWTDVQISPDPEAPLQVRGRDAKGRAQYIYSAKFMDSQSAMKFKRIKQLSKKYDEVLAQNNKAMTGRDKSKAEHALVTSLIMDMGLRPGSDKDTGADVQAYGATTLQSEHVQRAGKDTNLVFTGKKGVKLNLPVTDPKLASALRERAARGGPLFPGVTGSSMRRYVATLGGGGFKTKDLRTLKGTQLASDLVGNMPTPKSQADYKKAVRAVAVAVSKKLGNTPTVALQSYINPTVFAAWQGASK